VVFILRLGTADLYRQENLYFQLWVRLRAARFLELPAGARSLPGTSPAGAARGQELIAESWALAAEPHRAL